MHELMIKRITEYLYKDLPQTEHLFRRHGRFYKIFYGDKKEGRPQLRTVHNKTISLLKELPDAQLLEEFELLVITANRQWG
jgi:hypothetical protein